MPYLSRVKLYQNPKIDCNCIQNIPVCFFCRPQTLNLYVPAYEKPRFPGAETLQRAFISKRIKPVIPDNYVIEDSYIEQ